MATGNDTYTGALEVLAKQVSTMMGLADANLPFCVSLLEQITGERRSPELAMQAAGVIPPAAQNPMGAQQLGLPGGGMGGPGGMSAPPSPMMGAGVSGGLTTNSAPNNADELRRVLTA